MVETFAVSYALVPGSLVADLGVQKFDVPLDFLLRPLLIGEEFFALLHL